MTAILEFISDMAWPVVAAGALYYFKDPIKSSFTRITEVGPGGIKLGAAQAAVGQALAAAAPSVLTHKLRQIVSSDQLDPVAQSMKENVLTEVGPDKESQNDALLHVAAALSVQLGHERSFRLIFGSQLSLLAQMSGPIGAPKEAVEAVYNQAVASFPEFYKGYSFESWIGFLKANALITEIAGTYSLSPYGRGLLKYIVDQKLVANKPG
jgi:hypothetical protein